MADDPKCPFYNGNPTYCPQGCPRTWNTCHRRTDELVSGGATCPYRYPGAQCPAGCPRTGDGCHARTAPAKPDIRVEPKRSRILNTAKQLINGDRQNTYGDAAEDFTRTGKMWAAVLGLDTVTPEQVALCMTLVKIGRLCQTPNHEDSWVDGCGYLALGGEIATRDA